MCIRDRLISMPPRVILPLSMSQNLAASFALVDFPPPDGPTSAVTCPCPVSYTHLLPHLPGQSLVKEKDHLDRVHGKPSVFLYPDILLIVHFPVHGGDSLFCTPFPYLTPSDLRWNAVKYFTRRTCFRFLQKPAYIFPRAIPVHGNHPLLPILENSQRCV